MFFCCEEGQKTALQSFGEEEGRETPAQCYHFHGHLLLPQSAELAICSCNLAPALLFCFLTKVGHHPASAGGLD